MESLPKLRVIHLYHDLMNLYGDWANVKALERELTARGRIVETDRVSVDQSIGFTVYDFFYIGSGTERSQKACMRDLLRHKEALTGRIEAGVPVLATGNSHELFGRTVTDSSGSRHEALGLLDFDTVQTDTRITGDCVGNASFLSDRLVGFINRAGGCQEGGVERPFLIEPGVGANYSAGAEGIMYKNLLGTYMTGPVLVRNPPLLRYITDLLTGSDDDAGISRDDPFFGYQAEAYNLALNELS